MATVGTADEKAKVVPGLVLLFLFFKKLLHPFFDTSWQMYLFIVAPTALLGGWGPYTYSPTSTPRIHAAAVPFSHFGGWLREARAADGFQGEEEKKVLVP